MHVRCPRCGYDLRGVMGQWTDACPLDGTCSECGFVFPWANLFSTKELAQDWLVESAAYGVRGRLRVMVGTLWRMLLPWIFWRDLRLWHRVRLRRLVAFVLVMTLLVAIIAHVFVQTSTAIVVHAHLVERTTIAAPRVASALALEQSLMDHLAKKPISDPERAQIMRFAASQSMAIPEDGVTAFNQTVPKLLPIVRRESYAVVRMADGEVGMPLWRAIIDAVFRPLARESIDRTTGPGAPYPGPSHLHRYLASPHNFRGGMTGDSNMTAPEYFAIWGARIFGGAALLMALFPLSMLLLVQTRRLLKLRATHLVRIALYGLVLLAIFTSIWTIVVQITYLTRVGPFRYEYQLVPLTAAALLGWTFLWWWMALRRYARVPHALPVTVIHLVMCALIVMGLGSLLMKPLY